MKTDPLSFRQVKVVALSVLNLERANKFYGETLNLPKAEEASEPIGYLVGQTVLMLKPDSEVPPTRSPNPRITLEVDNARETEKELQALGITISDPIQVYDKNHYVGSFLDSEENKIWFCSYT